MREKITKISLNQVVYAIEKMWRVKFENLKIVFPDFSDSVYMCGCDEGVLWESAGAVRIGRIFKWHL